MFIHLHLTTSSRAPQSTAAQTPILRIHHNYIVPITQHTRNFTTLMKPIRQLLAIISGYSVKLDPTDSSITISRRLLQHIARNHPSVDDQPQRLIVVHAGNTFAFVVNPQGLTPEQTALADLQYNDRHRCFGFETLVPTVSCMLYRYRLPNRAVRLAVRPVPHPVHRFIYRILPPSPDTDPLRQKTSSPESDQSDCSDPSNHISSTHKNHRS